MAGPHGRRALFGLGLALALALTGCTPLRPGNADLSPTPVPRPVDGTMRVNFTPEESPQEKFASDREVKTAQDDQRKVWQTRITWLEQQVEEKDNALQLAATEISNSTEEVARTRKELQRWKQEVTDLRDRLKTVETENKDALAAAVRMLENLLERVPERSEPPAPGGTGVPERPKK